MGKLRRGVGAAMVCSFLFVPAALAETLPDALLKAYRSNPELQAARARQRGTDELVPIAKSGWRPTVIARGTATQTWSDTTNTPADSRQSLSLNIELSQPVFRGFKTVEGIKSARDQVRAGQQELLGVEQNILLRAVAAYMAVVRDQRLLGLRQQNVSNLQKQVRAAVARFEAGEVTTTDVSQSRARLASAEAGVAVAKANLKSSAASYEAVVGMKPGKLAKAHAADTPDTLDAALQHAKEINPSILQATSLFDASLHDIEVAKGDLLPEISLQATGNLTLNPARGINQSESATISGVVTVPIYQGGREYASVRQAKQAASEKQITIVTATRSVRQQVTSAWHVLAASRESIVAAQAQVSAAQKALDGINQEYLVGSRSTIDVLNAEQELLNARINQVAAEHDRIVASYQLQASIGRMTARNLGLPGPYYDAEEHYQSVKDKWIGLDAETVE
jgi:TolC family type I secretion outer membrane protein